MRAASATTAYAAVSAGAAKRPSGEGPDPDRDHALLDERLDGRGEPLVGENGGEDAVRQLTQLGDARVGARRPRASSGCGRPDPGAQQPQRERKPDEALLGAVVEVALEPLPFRVSGLDDARARRTKLLETCRRFGLQPFVLEREPGRGRHLLDELVVIEQARRVCEHGDDASFADECRPLLSRGGLHGARARVDETARPDRICEHKARIADDPGERVAQAAWRRRLRQLDDEPRDRRASATRADPAPGDGERGRDEGRGFAEPEPPLGRPIRNEAMVERDGEGGRDAAQVDDPGGHHRPVRPRSLVPA